MVLLLSMLPNGKTLVDVKMNLEMKANKNRKYPDLDVNDTVRISKKKEKTKKNEKAYGLIMNIPLKE